MGDDPMVIDRGNFLHLSSLFVVENCSGSGAKDGDDCIHLFSQFHLYQFSVVGSPDGEDAADGEVCVNDRAAIEWVEGDNIAISLGDLGVGRSFLAGEGLDQGVQFEVFFNDLITVDVLVELLVSEVIGGFKLEDG